MKRFGAGERFGVFRFFPDDMTGKSLRPSDRQQPGEILMRHVFEDDSLWPNKSLQPTPGGRLQFRYRVHLIGPAWLSFSR